MAQSSMLLVLAAIAARTTTLKLSSSVFLMPLYPALDVAEEIATLDQISDGRVMLSFGIGYRPYEYEYLGLNYRARASRLEEGLEIMLQAWTQPEVNFVGKHYRIEGAPVVPRPVQQPHPPIWLGGGADAGIDRAARLADGWMVDTLKPMPAVARKVGLYREKAAALGRAAQVCLVRNVGIGPTHNDIQRDWLPDTSASLLSVWKAGGRFTNGDELARKMMAGETLSIAEFAGDRDVAGTPDEIIEQIRRWQEISGCDYFLAMFGESPRPDVLRDALTLFGRKVIPAFQDEPSSKRGVSARFGEAEVDAACCGVGPPGGDGLGPGVEVRALRAVHGGGAKQRGLPAAEPAVSNFSVHVSGGSTRGNRHQ